jgi:hypothetical protein
VRSVVFSAAHFTLLRAQGPVESLIADLHVQLEQAQSAVPLSSAAFVAWQSAWIGDGDRAGQAGPILGSATELRQRSR